jgi:hypothetical protein
MKERNDLIETLQSIYDDCGAPWEELNLFGIRFEDDPEADEFNDFLGVATDDGCLLFEGTTDPGWNYTLNPIKGTLGAAHLCLGYHPGIWRIGIHNPSRPSKHEAFVQLGGPVNVWRDINKDGMFEKGEAVQTGLFDINLHRAGGGDKIGLWSAGCQVFKKATDLEHVLKMAKATERYQTDARVTWSYMLLDQSEIEL